MQLKFSTLPILLFITFLVCGFSNCASSDPEVTPSNLKLRLDISGDGSGDVTVTASADNATSFEIDFGVIGKAPIESATGIESYTYLVSGDYVVSVKAIGVNPKSFIWKTQIITVELAFVIPSEGYTTPTFYPGMDAVWLDEFDGTTLDETYWTFEIGDGCPSNCGWGNNELEYYQKANTTVADGYLVIEARKETAGGKQYTSSRIITKDKVDFKYGRVDIRAVLPKGQGIWPALWMLGSNISTVGWPRCGEIDIMEMVGGSPSSSGKNNTTHGTLHWFDEIQSQNVCSCGQGDYTLSSGLFADKFHVFSLVWDESSIKWYVDDEEFHVIDITPTHMTEFHADFFFIMNLAVGGNWPGSPDATTKFPQRMAVDYIRVFQPQ